MKHYCIWISAGTAVAVIITMIAISCGKNPDPGPGPGPGPTPNPQTDYVVKGRFGAVIEGKLKPAAKANVDEAKRFMQTGADMID